MNAQRPFSIISFGHRENKVNWYSEVSLVNDRLHPSRTNIQQKRPGRKIVRPTFTPSAIDLSAIRAEAEASAPEAPTAPSDSITLTTVPLVFLEREEAEAALDEVVSEMEEIA